MGPHRLLLLFFVVLTEALPRPGLARSALFGDPVVFSLLLDLPAPLLPRLILWTACMISRVSSYNFAPHSRSFSLLSESLPFLARPIHHLCMHVQIQLLLGRKRSLVLWRERHLATMHGSIQEVMPLIRLQVFSSTSRLERGSGGEAETKTQSTSSGDGVGSPPDATSAVLAKLR